ncbi:MAG: hypothetical protein K6G51_00120 [Sphaerochaetaceae bacterium]|nr:hypothetical protein [Sphaerochaetaceae bacterium]
MNKNTTEIVSVTEASQNKPKESPVLDMTDDEKIDFVAARILKRYHKAFEELAKC